MEQIKPKFTQSTSDIPADARLVMEVYLRPEGLAVAMTETFKEILCGEDDPNILIGGILEAVKDSLDRASRVQ